MEGQYYDHRYSTPSGDMTLRRPTWSMPTSLLPLDGLQIFIKNCKGILRYEIRP